MADPIPPPGAARRIAFRFVFSYLLLYSLELVASAVPGTEGLLGWYLGFWRVAVPWVGRHVLQLGSDIATVPTGSGDRTFDYVQVLGMLALAASVALAWTVADRRRRRYPLLAEGLRIVVRYTLGLVLLSYGMSKVFKVQFPFPSIDRLEERVGDSSPMALYWTFMGYSTPYTFAIGAAEVLGGVLLLFRRTTTLGALVTLAMMLNEVALAFCYDVPTKLLSSHLLLLAVFLLVPDARRLVDGLVLDRPTQPANLAPPFAGRVPRTGRLALKALIVGSVVWTTTQQNLDLRKQLRVRRIDGSKYLLITRGTHVLDDSPMNR